MGKNQNQHLDDSNLMPVNQGNQMSDNDPRDGNRTSFTVGKDGTTRIEKKPEHDRQGQDRLAELGERGTADTTGSAEPADKE